LKRKHTTRLLKGLLIIMISIVPHFALADGDDDPGPCPDCPIDGGLVVLLAAGVGYGVKKYKEAKKLGNGNFG